MNNGESNFYCSGGSMHPDSPSYIQRRADTELLEALLNGEFCYILTSRQMGKSSLMIRTHSKLRRMSVNPVLLDLTALGQNVTPEQWYGGMAGRLGSQLGLEDELEAAWQADGGRLAPIQRLFDLIRNRVLPRLRGNLVIFVDEIDCVRGIPFMTDEFFAAVREYYNRRAEDGELRRITFCFSGVATPTDLIRDANRNPFSIGRRIELPDFTEAEATPLAIGFHTGADRSSEPSPHALNMLRRVLFWTQGHPYLTQRLCRAVATYCQKESQAHAGGALSAPPTPAGCIARIDQICEELFLSPGARERDDNLLFVRERILRNRNILVPTLRLYGQILGTDLSLEDETGSPAANLQLAGLIRKVDGRAKPRNRIYAEVFNLQWVIDRLEGLVKTAPDAEAEMAIAMLRATQERGDSPPQTPRIKQVTVLMTRLRTSAPSGEAATAPSAEELAADLGGRIVIALTAHGGVIASHETDSITAVFGSTLLREDEPDEAMHAALAIPAEVRDFSETRGIPTQRIQFQVALHTGPAVIDANGAVRTPLDVQSTFVVTSSLLRLAGPGEIVTSHATFRRLRQPFEAEVLECLTAEGAPEAMEIYHVRRARPREFHLAPPSVEGIATRLVDRHVELARLQDLCLCACDEHDLHCVTLIGEAGIGKSRLLAELHEWLQTRRGATQVFYGRALESIAGIPYGLLRDVLAFRFEIQDSDRPAVARKKLEDGFKAFVTGGRPLDEAEQADIARGAHFIGHLAGFDFASSHHIREILGDTRQIRERALHYLAEWLRKPALEVEAPEPLTVIMLEDLHWADDASLDFFDLLAVLCQNAPLFMLCLTRPSLFERRPCWGEGRSNHVQIKLEPLSRRDCRALVDDILQRVPRVPAEIRDVIVSRSEGNPFFLEELVKMLVDVHVILPGTDCWTVDLSRLPAVKVPVTLTGVLQARLDHLSPRERTVLQHASVVGRVFWDTAVESFGLAQAHGRSGLAPSAVQDALASLRKKELIHRRETSAFAGAGEYVFRHALLRDVIYESLLEEQRKACHAHAAGWLVEQSGERVGEFAAVIAGHYFNAGDPEQSAEWFGRAGAQAKATYAPRMAIEYYENALRHTPPSTRHGSLQAMRRAEWLSGLGEALVTQARFAEAEAVYRQMLEAAEVAGSPVAAAQAWNGLAFAHERQGANRLSAESASRAAAIAEEAGTDTAAQLALVRALFLHGWAYYRIGIPSEVFEIGTRALRLCKQLNARSEMVNCLKLMAVGHLLRSEFELANGYFEHGLALARALGDRRNVSAMLSNLGETARLRGDHQNAVRYYEEAIVIAREIGSVESEMLYLSNLGGARAALGTRRDLETAEADLRRVLDQSDRDGTSVRPRHYVAETYRFLAEALLGLNRAREAFDAAVRSVQLGMRNESQEQLAGGWRVLGVTASHPETAGLLDQLRLPQLPAVSTPADCFAQSLRMCAAMGNEVEKARTLLAWSRWERATGSPAAAAAREAEATVLLARHHVPWRPVPEAAPPLAQSQPTASTAA